MKYLLFLAGILVSQVAGEGSMAEMLASPFNLANTGVGTNPDKWIILMIQKW
jgi:hypothetical protein